MNRDIAISSLRTSLKTCPLTFPLRGRKQDGVIKEMFLEMPLRFLCEHFSSFPKIALALLLLCAILPSRSFAGDNTNYEEISVFISVQNVGGEELPAIIAGNAVYLAIPDFFDFLKIKNNFVAGSDSLSGFFLNQRDSFLIDKSDQQITLSGQKFELASNDIIQTEENLYLKSDYFGKIFGLECYFNFRTLSVTMKTKFELPVIKERKEQQMRLNLDRLKGEVKVDTVIRRSNAFVRLGVADWAINSSRFISTHRSNENQFPDVQDLRMNLSLGAMVAGGEANVNINYDNHLAFDNRSQYFQWRYVNNDNHFLRQTIVGTINPQSTASIYSPIVGIQLTNSSTLQRQSFGTYKISDYTKPNWIVELYINNVLVNYVTADASGYFSFDVPLFYGSSSITLRYYGPWGEEEMTEKNIVIPFNLLPAKEIEYNISGGLVEDTKAGYLRASANYGLSNHVSIGTGMEYLSSVTSGPAMPFVNTFFRISSRLLFSGDYTYGVRSRGIFSYYGPANLRVQLNYTHYDKQQRAINFNYLEERKVDISIPVNVKHVHLFTQATASQIVFPSAHYMNLKWLLSGSFSGVGINLTNYGLFTTSTNPYLYADASLSCKLPYRFTFTPQAQYDYGQKKLVFIKGGLEKNIHELCIVNLSYERNLVMQTSSVEVAVRFNLSFSQIGASARRSTDYTMLSQSLRGSVVYDDGTNFMQATTRTNVGKGAITIVPFLDLNNNGTHEENEPRVFGLRPRIKGSTFEYNKKDSTFRAFNLIPYSSYLVDLNENNFENISWQVKNKTIKVIVDPNNAKLVEIPVIIRGEASGIISVIEAGNERGIRLITVNFYKDDSILVGSTMSEDDGYFSFFGLPPGSYTARVDAAQLDKLGMSASPAIVSFNISSTSGSEIIEDLNFVLEHKQGQNGLLNATIPGDSR